MGLGWVESLKGKAYLLKEKVVHEAMAVVHTIHPLGRLVPGEITRFMKPPPFLPHFFKRGRT